MPGSSSYAGDFGPLEPFEFVIDPAANAIYLEAEEDAHPRYIQGIGGAPPVVHPGALLNQSNITRSPTFRVGPDEAAVHTRDETAFLNPAYAGTRLRVSWTPAEGYEKRGRIYSVIDTLVEDENGRPILRRRATNIKSTAGQPIGQKSEGLAGEQPRPVAPPDLDTPAGTVLHGRPKLVTLERMRLFSGWPRKNIHTDEEAARAAGCPAPIASATQNMGHLCELLLDHFGEEWLTNGTLSLTFVRPIYAGDTVRSHAVITDSAPQGDAVRHTLTVSAVNQDGQPVTVGRATAVGPRRLGP
jgi:acyl dehydratase